MGKLKKAHKQFRQSFEMLNNRIPLAGEIHNSLLKKLSAVCSETPDIWEQFSPGRDCSNKLQLADIVIRCQGIENVEHGAALRVVFTSAAKVQLSYVPFVPVEDTAPEWKPWLDYNEPKRVVADHRDILADFLLLVAPTSFRYSDVVVPE